MSGNDRERRFLVRLLHVEGVEKEIIEFMKDSERKNGDLLRRWVVLGFILSERSRSAGAVLESLGLGSSHKAATRRRKKADKSAEDQINPKAAEEMTSQAAAEPPPEPIVPVVTNRTRSSLTALMGSGQ